MGEQNDKPESCGTWKQFWSGLDAEIVPESSDNAVFFDVDF